MKTYVFIFAAALALSFLLGLVTVPLLKKLKAGQSVLSYVKEHESKGGTPTMGGVFFILAASVVALIFCDKGGFRPALVVITTGVAFLAVGFTDDFIKIKFRHNEGLKPYQKILFQLAVSVIFAVYAYVNGYTSVFVPFTEIKISLGLFAIPLYITALIATTNCVNLTDGLDGLAGGVSYVYFLLIALVIMAENGSAAADNHAVISVALAGAIVGFLVFNTHRASVFMGDTGSLSLGGFVSAVSILSGNVFYIPVIGIMFVVTGLSVILQVAYFKKTGNRIFLMAPLHHHFQMKGAEESKIAAVYKVITLAAGLAVLLFI